MQKSHHIFSAMQTFSNRLKKGRRLHMCSNIIKKLTKKKYGIMPSGMKPRGLWYGFDGSWSNWCAGNTFKCGKHFYEVGLDTSRILRIENLNQFEEFEKEYTCDSIFDRIFKEMGIKVPSISPLMVRAFGPSAIDWPRLKKEYAGLEINPWMHSKHLESVWYYGWDCASGVIWDISAINQFQLFASYCPREKKFIHNPSLGSRHP